MDTYAVPEQSQQQCRQQDDFQPEKAMEKVAGKGPRALFGSAESTRTYQEPAEHEEDDDRGMAELGQEIYCRSQDGMRGGLGPIHKQQGTEVLEGDCGCRESSSQIEVSRSRITETSCRGGCRQLCGGDQSLTPLVPEMGYSQNRRSQYGILRWNAAMNQKRDRESPDCHRTHRTEPWGWNVKEVEE